MTKDLRVQPRVQPWQWAFVLALHTMAVSDLLAARRADTLPETPDTMTADQMSWCVANFEFVLDRRSE